MAVGVSDRNPLSELVDTTRIDQPVELAMDESKKNYLHAIAGSDALRLVRGCLRSQWFDTRRCGWVRYVG